MQSVWTKCSCAAQEKKVIFKRTFLSNHLSFCVGYFILYSSEFSCRNALMRSLMLAFSTREESDSVFLFFFLQRLPVCFVLVTFPPTIILNLINVMPMMKSTVKRLHSRCILFFSACSCENAILHRLV